VLAPTHAQADEVVRDAAVGRRATTGRHRLGLATLATRLALPALAAGGTTPLSALGFEAVVARALSALAPADVPPTLTTATDHPGFLTALATALSDVRMAGLTPDALAAAGGRASALAPYARALERSLETLRQADRAQVLSLAIAALDAGERLLPTVPDIPVLVVDPTCAAHLERAFVAAVVRRATRAFVVGPVGDAGIEALAADLAVPLEQAPAVAATPAPGDTPRPPRPPRTSPPPSPSRLRRVQDTLFSPAADRRDDEAGTDASVLLLSAPGEGRECVEIARRLADAAAGGLPFDRMAVVLRAPHLYVGYLETALRRAGIPAWFAHGTRRPHPAGRALLALLACALENVSARRFAEYLSLGQVPRTSDPLAAPVIAVPDTTASSTAGRDTAASPPPDYGAPPPRSPWRWEAVLDEAAVLSGADRWPRRLAGHREELRLRADGLALDEPESPRVESLRRRMALVDELTAFALPIVATLDDWRRGAASWGTWLTRLRALASVTLQRPDALAPVFDELQPMADVGDVMLREVFDVLRPRLTQLTEPPPDTRYGRVFVGTPEDVRARSFALVCVAGLSERVFPQRSRQDPLLLDADRRRISDRLAHEDRRVADERLRLRLAVGAASSHLVASFASFDAAQSRPRVPSFYALDVYRAAGGRLVGYDAVLRDAQRASGARLAWPAHADATRAIDRTEHDLSVLQRYLRGDIDDVRGRARYLFEGHPGLRRSLLMQHERTRRKWTGSDGVVADARSTPILAQALARHRLHARAYSVSALQRFATCPYQFHLSTIVRLAPRQEAVQLTTLDPLTRGSIVHEILATAMRTFETRGWRPLRQADVADAMQEADRIVERVTAGHKDRLLPPVERIWLDEVQAIRQDTREWVRRLPTDQRAWTPRYVELGFGFGRGDGRDDASVAADVTLEGGWRLHGVIDLVEQGANDTWRITDYKTGRSRPPERMLVNGGQTLQPVLYAMALERALGGRVEASRLWFCTADGGFTEIDVPVAADHDASARARATTVLEAIDRAVDVGFLPAAPRDKACTWCDFLPVCGPSAQTRTRGKPRVALGDLLEIRNLR